MEPWEDFRFVVGYLPYIDQRPQAAEKLGLMHRMAAVLNDSRAPHSAVYWDLVEALVDSLNAQSVTFEIDTDRETRRFSSILLMREYVRSRPNADCVFHRATLCHAGKVRAFIDVEPWASVGGPYPYHDAWTFAIYRDTDDVSRLRDACYQVCMRHGLAIGEEIYGLAAPKKRPRWKSLLRWLIEW